MRDSVSDQLLHLAAEIADVAQSKVENLNKEIKDAAQQKAQAEVELRMAESAMSQVAHYDAGADRHYLCPYCWIERDTRAELKPGSPAEPHGKTLRCETCGTEIKLEH